MEQTKYNNAAGDWAKTGLVRTMTDEHEGDLECTQTSAHINSGLMLTDSIRAEQSTLMTERNGNMMTHSLMTYRYHTPMIGNVYHCMIELVVTVMS